MHLDGDYYVVNLDKEKESSISLSSLIKCIQTIILETNDECLIGNIDELQVFDGNLYVLDSDKAKSLFVFDKKGIFLRKIGRVGQGPGEYISPRDFTLDLENRIIYILDQRNRILKYNTEGTPIETIEVQLNSSRIDAIQYYNGKLYAYYVSWEKSDENCLLLEIDKENGRIISRSLSLELNKGSIIPFRMESRIFMSRGNTPPRFNLMFMDYIVSIGEKIMPYVELKSKNLTTERDIENFRGVDNRTINTVNNIRSSNKLFNVHCFIENEEFMCFRHGIFYSSPVVLVDKQTGNTKLANKLTNDMIFNQDKIGRFGRFIFADTKGAYEVLHSLAIEGFQQSIRNKETVPDLDKADELLKLEADANPVIFYYEFK